MKPQLIFILFKKKVISKWSVFKDSILYYPIIFSIIVFVGFLITSKIDEGFDNDFDIDLPYFSSLIFSGSANAARSILSTIATGWATILGVAFSVTLITLQLSTTRYTSHLVHKFEEDRINKLTLGWFISVVLYSLLVLKTVRSGEGTSEIFTPVIGVNVAILMASIGLFIFVLYLNNISSYLKPKILVLRLVDQIICSIKPYKKRNIDKKSLLNIKDDYKPTTTLSKGKEQKVQKKVLDIKSKDEGILMNIDWSKLDSSLKKIQHNNLQQSNIVIEFSKFIGDSINKGNLLAIVYEINNSINNNNKNDNKDIVEKKEYTKENDDKKDNIFNNYTTKNNKSKNNDKREKNIIEDLEQKIFSSIDINKEQNISNDPVFGIELLRSLAIKSASNNDIDVTNACITGLFKILFFIWNNTDVFGIPFTIKIKRKITKEKKSIEIGNDEKDDIGIITITIKPKEKPLTDIILSELYIINHNTVKGENIPIIKHFMNEYISISKTLLENDKKDKFDLVTDWYSQILNYSFHSFHSLSKEHINNFMINPLIDFQKYLYQNYEYATASFNIYMKNIIKI
jgi:uncharacterized membrane protein